MKPDIRIQFHHPQKTGGRSTAVAFLTAVCSASGCAPDQTKNIVRTVQAGTSSAIFRVGPFILNGPYAVFHVSHHFPPPPSVIPDGKFHLVQFREPMSRLVSHFRMLNAGDQSISYDRQVSSRPQSLKEFAERAPASILMRQLDTLAPETHKPEEAIQVLERMDHVIFLDRYDEDLTTLAEKLDLPELRPLHVGSSINRHYGVQELMSDEEACAILRQRAAKEFDFWQRLLEWRDKR